MSGVGFTGSEQGMTRRQRATAYGVLRWLREEHSEFHHGNCVGADEQAALDAGQLGYRRVAHLGPDPKRRGSACYEEARQPLGTGPMAFLARNGNIARETSVLVAAPSTFSEVRRSGTWSTVRRARALNRRVLIVWPDGSMTDEPPDMSGGGKDA